MPIGMSRADLYEVAVADYINQFENVNAIRPKVSTHYSDVLVKHNNESAWLEVKMNHADNLGNTRCFFDGVTWDSSRKHGQLSPLKRFCVDTLNTASAASRFIVDLEEFSGMKNIKIPTTRGGLRDPSSVPLRTMKSFFEDRDRYILSCEDVDLGALVTSHYTQGKAEPAHYMQAGDDFYLIGPDNPLGLNTNIPHVSGIGAFRMRVSTRSKFYEIQPEVKIRKMPHSDFSIMPGTTKLNPFSR